MMSLGERIKILQEEHRISGKEIAELLNVASNTVSGYVNDKSEMTFESLVALANLFQVTTDYLLGLTDDPSRPLVLSDTERGLVERFRALSREQKELLLHTAAFMQKQNQR